MMRGKFGLQHSKKLTLSKQENHVQIKKETENNGNQQNKLPFNKGQGPFFHSASKNKKEKSRFLASDPQKNEGKELRVLSEDTTFKLPELRQTLPQRKFSLKKLSTHGKPIFSEGKPQNARSLMLSEDKMAELFGQFLQVLKRNQILSEISYPFINIKTSEFHRLVLSLIQIISNSQQNDSLQPLKMKGIKNIIRQLSESLCSPSEGKAKNSLNVASKTFQFSFSSKKYERQLLTLEKDIGKLHSEMSTIQLHLSSLKETESSLKKQCEFKQKKLSLMQSQFYDLAVKRQTSENEYERVTQLLSAAKSNYNETLSKSQEMLNYVSQQETNKILKMVSKDYKQIEADIYEYAVYLQSNELATSYTYQPHPFEEIERELMEEMKSINKTIIQQETLTLNEKTRLMRDFIMEATEKFKKKDHQMSKLSEFKTKCIREFVERMKKWLNNWELKQEYLVNLRSEFVIDSSSLNHLIQQAIQDQKCEGCSSRQVQLLQQLQLTFHKIEENYRLGNSFY